MTDAKARYAAADSQYVAAFDVNASPARLHLALALADTVWEPADRERLTVIDIGCGRGLTVLVLAAANPDWDVIGLDLQPVHVAEARALAAEAGLTNARFIEADLAELDEAASGRLLPEVDIVLCNGVWTWVPDPVRQGIVRLLKSRVKPGGLVLMGYNSLPGFADCIVLQRLLMEAVRGITGTEAAKVGAAFDVIEALRAAGSPYLPQPAVLDYVIQAARTTPAYAAHEWFTPFWRPVFHDDLARDLAAARLEFGANSRPSAALVEFQLTPEQRQGFAALPGNMPFETLTDSFLDRRFRSDIFVRGRRSGGRAALGDIRLALGTDPAHVVTSLGTRTGVVELSEPRRAELLEALSRGPQRIGDLAELPSCRDLTVADIALMLFETYAAHPLWRDIPRDPESAARVARCNDTIARRLGHEAQASRAPLAAVVPALGSGFATGMSSLAVIAAIGTGVPATAEDLARRLAPQGSDAAALDRLRGVIATTLEHNLDAWRALGLV